MEKHKNIGARITLWVNRLVALTVGALLFLLPSILDWYREFRWLEDTEKVVLLICFYLCAVAIGLALWSVDRLLTDILAEAVFTRKNVRRIRIIRLCCGIVSESSQRDVHLLHDLLYPEIHALCTFRTFNNASII